MRQMWILLGVGVVLTGAACSSPTIPTAIDRTWLTVETRQHNSNGALLAGVSVLVDGRLSATTGADGAVTFEIAPGERTVRVEKLGWTPYLGSATGDIKAGSHERWMFALEENK